MVSEYLNLGKVLWIVLGFHIMFCTINVLQNLSDTMIKEAGFGQLGFYENGVMYLMFAFASV
jgi:hypothetical protein